MRPSVMKSLRYALTVGMMMAALFPLASDAQSVKSATDEVPFDRIILKNGTVFEGQIVEGTKTLVDQPNFYEIVLNNGMTVAIEDQGQIELVLMDGVTLKNPRSHGGRGRLLQMVEEYQQKLEEERLAELFSSRRGEVEWLLGDIALRDLATNQSATLLAGTPISVSQQVVLSSSSRLVFRLPSGIRIGLEQGTVFVLEDIQVPTEIGYMQIGFNLVRGAAWFEHRAQGRDQHDLEIVGNGIRMRFPQGLFRIEFMAKELLVDHYNGPQVSIVRMFDGRVVEQPTGLRYVFSADMIDGKTTFSPTRLLIPDLSLWANFRQWTPVELDFPLQFVFGSESALKLRAPLPVLGIQADEFVFQDLQPIMVSGLGAMLKGYRRALADFFADLERFPTVEEGLEALRTPPEGVENWAGPYVDDTLPRLDPWNHPLVYSVIDTEHGLLVDLYSIGKNGIDEQGLGDDIR